MTNSGLDSRDQQLIAAFIDRRMSAEERQVFMKRLDEEDDLYEVFTETVRCRDQQSGRPAEVVEHPAARRRWGRIAAAASLVAVAVTPVVLLNLPAGRYAPRLVADGLLGDVLEEGWLNKDWATMRGPAPGTDEFDTAFRLGVRQVDLEVALALGRGQDASELALEMDILLGTLSLADVMRTYYQEVARLADTPAKALEQAERSDPELREFLAATDAAAVYDLGQWTEAGVLASRSGNTALLGSRSFRRAPRGFPRREWAESGHPLADQLDAVEALLEADEDRLDLERLHEAFTAIIDDR